MKTDHVRSSSKLSMSSNKLLGFVLLASWLFAPPMLAAQEPDVADAIRHGRALSLAFRNAAAQTTPAVVTLVATASPEQRRETLRRLLDDPRFGPLLPDDFEGELPEADILPELSTQVGCGLVIDAAGVILTNNHVVEDASEVLVRFSDGREFIATEVKNDPLSDLAIIRIPSDNPFETATLGDSADLQIGDWVIAIGSPFELEATVSAGIISGQGRGIDRVRGRLLQTDAAINPGNSGGPLVNLEGQVVGINTAIATNHGGYQGVGFAIPINRAKWVAAELMTHGAVRRAFLGTRVEELSAAAAVELKLTPRAGVYVREVIANSPADEAGLKTNDVITEFADEQVRAPRDLVELVEQQPVGSQKTLKIMRRGEPKEFTVTLKALE